MNDKCSIKIADDNGKVNTTRTSLSGFHILFQDHFFNSVATFNSALMWSDKCFLLKVPLSSPHWLKLSCHTFLLADTTSPLFWEAAGDLAKNVGWSSFADSPWNLQSIRCARRGEREVSAVLCPQLGGSRLELFSALLLLDWR